MPAHALLRPALFLALLPVAGCLTAYDSTDPGTTEPAGPALAVGTSSEALTGGTLIASYNSTIWNMGVAFTSFATPTGWSIDHNHPSQYGYQLRRWTNVNTSKLVTGQFVKVDLAGNSWLWGMTAGGAIMKNTYPYASDGGTWQLVCTCNARDFAAGADGSVIVIP